jgi:hypothetical protein
MPGRFVEPDMTLNVDGEETTVDRAMLNVHVIALRQVGESVNRQWEVLQKLVEGQHAMDIKLAHIEAHDFKSTLSDVSTRLRSLENLATHIEVVKELTARVRVLEDTAQQRKGVKGAIDWLGANWQFLAALLVGLAAYFGYFPRAKP